LTVITENFQQKPFTSRKLAGFPGAILNLNRFPGFSSVVDTQFRVDVEETQDLQMFAVTLFHSTSYRTSIPINEYDGGQVLKNFAYVQLLLANTTLQHKAVSTFWHNFSRPHTQQNGRHFQFEAQLL